MMWIRVEDSLPSRKGEYLTTDGYSYHLSEFNKEKWTAQYGYEESEYWSENMSHWMPLPEVPR